MLANSLANTSINDSVNKCPDHQPIHHLHLVVYSVVLAAGLPLNALALWVFLRALRVHSVVSVYMCNLAASDLLFTLSLPLRLSYYARHYWPFSELLCQLAGAVFQMNMYGSCIFLTLINVDRYAAIVHPLRLRHLRRPRVARLLCLGVWALILVFAVPTVLVHRPSSCTRDDHSVRLCFESFSDELWKGKLLPLVLLAEALGFLLPLAAVVYSSGRVFWTLARPDATQSRRRRKTVRLLLANLVIFLLCFVPYNATLAVYGLLRGHVVLASPEARSRVRRVLMVLVLLAGANCVLDPLVYYFSAEGFRNTLRGLSTPLRDRTLAANGARGALAEPSTETSHATTTAAGSQGLLGPSNPRSSFLQCQDPEDSSL
ncbi:lysophosphatidic acid receptor 5 [Camelus dromedarius]|uniref:Lysophosphatidic acid receptor 5 n=12 Tax=Camelus TaxID=9836 RepID=A0A8B8SF36_CAMFR|nr:lysophosphatidic acid receptor 5 [Camelus ferus]XP_010989163.2 lysophosphatidic acid receptor 5 [Camelus dromedarius]XP_031300075.1 lysophosphatidic acid receptor 5 [Camelus dromedarius]XP_031300076.1 lysophosphatidic acid receptor 5 [Camelus dromedarius]XP_031300077.1 lysophosphatidic acid receptor 5 [Camelus dromedarius]XP_031300078.1 lysophosphatidic acid receptor 5 [Camelus dromedarius]XP_031300079.1 lysophosphatidic acid receptor 5 [Camelus dromedarius]XP_031300080.1 lysophosphatidic